MSETLVQFHVLKVGDWFYSYMGRSTPHAWKKIGPDCAERDNKVSYFDPKELVYPVDSPFQSGKLPPNVTIVTKDCSDIPVQQEGTKYDQDKLRYDLVPAILERGVAEVMTFGAKKYGDLNWQKGIRANRIYAAMRRHLDAWWRGEDIDPESGLPHLAHLAANAGMWLGMPNKESLDNRKGYSHEPIHDA